MGSDECKGIEIQRIVHLSVFSAHHTHTLLDWWFTNGDRLFATLILSFVRSCGLAQLKNHTNQLNRDQTD